LNRFSLIKDDININMNSSSQDNNRSRQGRIPATLQAVFLASNRGRDVNKPPPAQVASKVYFRNWLFQKQAGSKERRGSLFGGMGKSRKTKKEKKFKNAAETLKGKAVKTPKAKVCQSSIVKQIHYTVRTENLLSTFTYYASLTLQSPFDNLPYRPLPQPWPLRFTWMP
jgi:hypothetical protein